MAESHGWDFTRAFLKRQFGTRDRMYPFHSARSWDVCRVEDDFTGPVIDSNKWTAVAGAGAGAAAAAIDVGLNNGAIKLVTGTAGDSTASSTLAGGRHFRGDQNAVIIARVKIESVVTGVKVEIGFRDAITNAAVVNVKATPTFTATDGAVWIFDTNNAGRGWDGLAVANGVAATSVTDYNVSPVASTYEYLEVALVDGLAYYSHFTVDGTRDYGPTVQAAAVTSTVLLSPHIYVEARNATSKTLNVDWVLAYQGRTSA